MGRRGSANEKAECRYLLDLCQRLSGSRASLDEVIEVAHVIRAKHDKVPPCFAGDVSPEIDGTAKPE